VGHASSLIWESRALYRINGTVVKEDEIGQSEPRIRKKRGLGWGIGNFKH